MNDEYDVVDKEELDEDGNTHQGNNRKSGGNMLFMSVITIAIGLVLVLNPESAVALICRIIGVILLVYGGIMLFSTSRAKNMGFRMYGSMAIAVVSIAVGIYMLIFPRGIQTVVAVIFALILILHGVGDIREAIVAKRFNDKHWYFALLMGIVCIIFGIVVLMRPVASIALPFRIIGIFLLVDGASNLFLSMRK